MNQNRTTGNGFSRTWRPGMRFTPAVLVVAVVGIIVWANAGSLNPPAGPITATQRTPISSTTTPGDADSLYRINARGSYYLTGNITGVSAKHGIEIAASGVTLDLMGFDVLGVSESLNGISTTAPHSIRNHRARMRAVDGV